MAEQPTLDEDAILRIVRLWPRDQQLQLAHHILRHALETLDPHTGRPYVSSAALRGIGSGGRPAPSDEEIERWRIERHGV